MGFFSTKTKNKIFAIFDISSSSVSGALVLYKMNKKFIEKPFILIQTKTIIREEREFEFNNFLRNTLIALEESAKELLDSKKGSPEKILCYLSSPWLSSKNRSIILEKQTPFIFTKKIADNLIKKELEIDYKKIKKFSKHKDIELIERKTTQIKLNGYETSEPFGKKVKHVEIFSFSSLISSSTKNDFENSIGKYFGASVEFHSSFFHIFHTFKKYFLNNDDAVILDSSGELTDIILIKDKLIHKIASFPFAEKTIIRLISKKLKIHTIDKTRSLIHSFIGGCLDKNYSEKIKLILEEAKKEWFSEFKKVIKEISKEYLFYPILFIYYDSEISKFFLDSFSKGDFNNYILNKKSFNTIDLEEFDWIKFIDSPYSKVDLKLVSGAIFGKSIIR